jgi:DNA-directed RNA polymerase subunit K/omega
MIDQNKFEELYEIGGGVFKTTVLMQKRLKELNRGARQLVAGNYKNPIETVMHEIDQRTIQLLPDTDENRKMIADEIEKMSLEAKPLFELTEESPAEEIEAKLSTDKRK